VVTPQRTWLVDNAISGRAVILNILVCNLMLLRTMVLSGVVQRADGCGLVRHPSAPTGAEIDSSADVRQSIRQISTIASDTAYSAQSEAARISPGHSPLLQRTRRICSEAAAKKAHPCGFDNAKR
jgi:hypothetical protein